MYILYRNTALAVLILMVCVSMKDKCAVKRKLLSLFPHWKINFMESGCLSIYSKHIQALGYCESFWFNECHGKSALDKSEMFATTITSERFIFTLKYSSSPSPALPQWTLVSVRVCTCHLPCLCLFSFFSDGLCCFAAVYRTFFPFGCGRSVCAFLLPCDLQAITMNLSLCGIPAFPTVPPFSCHCTPMTGVLWPLLHRQCRFLADISRHSSGVLRQWRLHSVIYSTWTPNTTSCHFALLQFLKMHVCSFLVIKQTGFFKFVSERWTRQSVDCNNVIDVHW